MRRSGRSWGDALLGRPWVLVAIVALVVAAPVLVLGQASEDETRARLKAAQVESAAKTVQVVARGYSDRLSLIRNTLAALALSPRPATSAFGLAVQRGDVATLQAIVDTVQRLYPHDARRVYVALRGDADTIADGTIVAAAIPSTDLMGRRLSELTGPWAQALGSELGQRSIGDTGAISLPYPGTKDTPSAGVFAASLPGNAPGNVQGQRILAPAVIVVEGDASRVFAEAALPSLGPEDDAYALDQERRLYARAIGPVPFPWADLKADPFLQLVNALTPTVVRSANDPLGGGSRLIASAPLPLASSFTVVLVRDTSVVDREIELVLGQLAAARYVLVALLLLGAYLVALAARAQVRQQRRLADANRQIEAASLHKSSFLSSMSHEIRTPLNSINGFSDVLLTGMAGALTDKQREYIGDIRASGAQLLALVNDVLDLSKVEAGRVELQPRDFDLRESVENVHRAIAPLAQQKRQTLTLAADGAGVVHLDEARLRQVLLNVLSNAVKYTPEGGTVGTTITRRAGRVEIAVHDTGAGIAPEDQARVFEDFARIETGYAATQQGTGLGLPLARRFVRLMGGDISVGSELGRGSTFTISVPA